ncbi:MAG: NHL repeat-containing protein [Gammaproteobacteria bacterium]|nr:NHL repeat-containing protein [Gammaproteobacteria bacterium]
MISRLPLLLLAALLSLPAQATNLELTFVSSSPAVLGNPHDLKLSPNGRFLFVADVDNDRVAILDPESLALVGEFGADHQDGTHDIDFDARGRAYVADTHNNRVTIYEMENTRARLVGELGERIRGPEGVLAHPNGIIYVAGAWSGNVVAYREGDIVGELGGLSSPHDLELARNGDIWLADAGNSRLLLLSPELEIKRELAQQKYDFNGVRYLDLSDEGILIAADKYSHAVKFIAADGKLLHVLGDGRAGQGENRFTTPEGVEVRGSELWLSDSGNDRVVKYRFVVE